MRIITIILAALLLTGCIDSEERKTLNIIKRNQVESYLDEERKQDNLQFKFTCVSLSKEDGNKENAEFVASTSLTEQVTCPTDLKPFNEGWSKVMGIIGTSMSFAIFFLGVVFLKRIGILKLFAVSAEGTLTKIIKGVFYFIGLVSLIPLPSLGYVSYAYLFTWIIGFSSLHNFNVFANYIYQPAEQAMNIKIHKPSSLYAAPQFENLIRFYESSVAVNDNRNTSIDFEVVGDNISAETYYKNNILAFNMQLNPTAYELCDKYSLNCGKDYQVKALSELLTKSFKEAEFHARKIVNYKTSLYSIEYEDFRAFSCADLRNYSLGDVEPSVAVAYRYRAAECVSEQFNEALNNVGSPYGDAKAQMVDLCPMAIKTTQEAANCVAQAYQKSLYAGSVATELYHKIYQSEKANVINVFTMVLLKFSGNASSFTEAGKIFYKSIDIKFFNDLEEPAYENTFKPTAFSIDFNNTFNPSLPDSSWLAKLDTEFDYKDSSTTGSDVSYDNIVSKILTGPDGFCGIERKNFCTANPYLITDKYSCGSEFSEGILFGVNVAQCGLSLKVMNGLGKRFSGKNRNRNAEGTASNSIMSLPNMLTGLKIAAPIAAIANLDAMLDDPWSNSEFEFQQQEMLYIFFWTLINNDEIRKVNDSIADKLIAYGTTAAIGKPVMVAMFLIFLPLSIIAYMFSKTVKSLITLVQIEKEEDETLDLNPFLIDMFKIFIRAFCYLAGYFIADHCYNEAIRALSEFDLTGSVIQTQSIITTIISVLSTETVKLAFEFLFITIYYGGIEAIVTYIYKIAFSEEIADSINIEEAKQTLDNSKQAIKK